MRIKALSRISVSMIALLSGATPVFGQAQETPKPTTASDQSANPSAPAPSTQAEPEENGEIVVTGLRRSLQSAQAVKRNSDGIVDAIVAEDIGKLPDTFASAALARVSGVQVTRGSGEAAGVQIRGLPDISTTYNGREIFTAEGRFVWSGCMNGRSSRHGWPIITARISCNITARNRSTSMPPGRSVRTA